MTYTLDALVRSSFCPSLSRSFSRRPRGTKYPRIRIRSRIPDQYGLDRPPEAFHIFWTRSMPEAQGVVFLPFCRRSQIEATTWFQRRRSPFLTPSRPLTRPLPHRRRNHRCHRSVVSSWAASDSSASMMTASPAEKLMYISCIVQRDALLRRYHGCCGSVERTASLARSRPAAPVMTYGHAGSEANSSVRRLSTRSTSSWQSVLTSPVQLPSEIGFMYILR